MGQKRIARHENLLPTWEAVKFQNSTSAPSDVHDIYTVYETSVLFIVMSHMYIYTYLGLHANKTIYIYRKNIYLDPPFGLSNFSPHVCFWWVFWAAKFQTRLRDSGICIYIYSKSPSLQLAERDQKIAELTEKLAEVPMCVFFGEEKSEVLTSPWVQNIGHTGSPCIVYFHYLPTFGIHVW